MAEQYESKMDCPPMIGQIGLGSIAQVIGSLRGTKACCAHNAGTGECGAHNVSIGEQPFIPGQPEHNNRGSGN